MKALTALLTIFAILLASTAVFAQSEETKHQFIDIGPMFVDGETQAPQLLRYDGTPRAEFEPLLQMEKSFMNKIIEDTNL